MTTPWPQTQYDVLEHYTAQYEKAIQSEGYQPFIYPWATSGALIVILYLLIPHQNLPWLRNARLLIFAWTAAFAAYTIAWSRAKGMAVSFGIGLVSSWSVIYIMAIIVVNDAQVDFQRIERTEGVFGKSKRALKGDHNEMIADTEKDPKDSNQPLNGATSNGTTENVHGHLRPSQRHGEFAWQPYPMEPFLERLDWILDLFCNFKGMGWNWRISSLSPPPKHILEQLHRNSSHPPQRSHRIHGGQTKTYTTRKEVLFTNMKTLITGYIVLDFLKTLMSHDPYFWGLTFYPLPPSFLPLFISTRPSLMHAYRLTVSMLMIKYSLQSVFALAPLFFSGLLGPSLIGARAEPWMYPSEWGSYSLVFERGLAGWWAGWWHQTFQFAFKEPSRMIIEITGLNRRSPTAKALQLFIAFGLSGFLHACGSYTQPGPSRPIRGPMVFFLLQAGAIFVEMVSSQMLRKTKIQRLFPKWVLQTFTFVYVHVWFYHTGHLLCDDFTQGGIWLYQPVPFSIFRGLGLGVKEDRVWNWGGEWVRWHRGKSIWTSGLTF
ncbi:hypothetical protein P154DRAFT_519409 [Amniculicola lignicola CBS 123094]|uniref:Wax synthase domain-containing protein n=1 Tax=Amniculicola lignicola CBS 123094 TaxID=1392246 RepID=A0A6A5WSJ9_9PLEO|nr:hypothetical protein P154DRAFT_519409 [Amniculicola lignicola CBS 123094]